MKKLFRNIQDARLRSTGEEGKTLEGYPIVFGQRSVLIPDWEKWKMVYEIIEPGAIDDDLLRNSDIMLNLEHNRNMMLGRMVNGEGSMSASIDKTGVRFSTEVPDTPYGKQALVGVERKDYRGMSFAYSTDEDVNVTYTKEKDENGDEVLIRHVNKIDGLYDFAIVADPAYPDTSVSQRSAADIFGTDIGKYIERDLGKQPKPQPAPEVSIEDMERLRSEASSYIVIPPII